MFLNDYIKTHFSRKYFLTLFLNDFLNFKRTKIGYIFAIFVASYLNYIKLRELKNISIFRWIPANVSCFLIDMSLQNVFALNYLERSYFIPNVSYFLWDNDRLVKRDSEIMHCRWIFFFYGKLEFLRWKHIFTEIKTKIVVRSSATHAKSGKRIA